MKIVLFNTYIFDNNFIFNIINFCSSLINISNLLIFGLISILSLIFIHMSKKPLLDAAHKVITTVAAASVIYKNVIKGGGGGATSSNDDDKDNDKDKNKNNKSNTEPDNGGNSGSTDNNSNSNNSNTTDTSESQNK